MSVSLLESLGNKINYRIQQMVVDPEAEKYAAQVKASEDAAAAAEKKRKEVEAATPKVPTAEEKLADEKAKQEEIENNQFSGKRLFKTILSTIVLVFLALFVVGCALYGASLATNLNIYRTWPYRLLYAIYGFVFFPLVIIYCVGYRWFWLGRKPVFYSLLPLIPYRMNRPWMDQFFGWLSYRPDEISKTLQEWNPAMVDAGKEFQERMEIEEALATVIEETA
jgi:hypothetical protein